MKVKILQYILFIKYVKVNMNHDDCYKLKLHCKLQSESFFRKNTF